MQRPNVWIDRFKIGNNTVDRNAASYWENNRLLQEIKDHNLCDICMCDETSLFFNLQLSKSLTICGDPCHGKTKSK